MLEKQFQIDENGKPTHGGSYCVGSEALCREWTYALVSSGRAVLICMGMNVAVLLGSTGSRSAGAYPFHINSQLNVSRSQASAQTLVIKELSESRFQFSSGPTSYVVVADGTDQPVASGNTISLKKAAENRWTIVKKRVGEVISTSQWTIAPSGKAITMRTTENNLGGGGTLTYSVLATRISGDRGLAGTWKVRG